VYVDVPSADCRQCCNIKTANRSVENIAKFKCVGMTVRDQNLIHDKIESSLNSGNACYYSFQNLLPSCLMYRNVKIKIYKIIILAVVLYGCETWSLALRKGSKQERI
jgi:hypothetical protein